MRRVLLISWVLAVACSPGPGEAPVYPDASVREDGGLPPEMDATVIDAEPPDAGLADAGLPDASAPAPAPFSGIFGILNTVDLLFAREVEGQLVLVLRDYPYHYVGTIDALGNVDTTAPALNALGCLRAFIRGTYDRTTATFQLIHETCNAEGQPIGSTITGGFTANFVPGMSGVFQLSAKIDDPMGCYAGPTENLVVSYAVNFYGNARVFVATTRDFLGAPVVYDGSISDTMIMNVAHLFPWNGETAKVTMAGVFEQVTANDPLKLRAIRTVYDVANQCWFDVELSGVRVVAP